MSQVWIKHSGHPTYRKEAKLYLPGKTLEEIEHHEEWHQELIHLQDRKREVENLHKAYMYMYKLSTKLSNSVYIILLFPVCLYIILRLFSDGKPENIKNARPGYIIRRRQRSVTGRKRRPGARPSNKGKSEVE